MACVQVIGKPKLAQLLRNVVLNNWINSEDYKAKLKVSPFLQGYDERSGWALVEFWLGSTQDHLDFVDYLNAKFGEEGSVDLD